MSIRVNSVLSIRVDICVEGSFGGSDAARLALIWSSIGLSDCIGLGDWHGIDRGLTSKFSDRSGIGGLADGSLIDIELVTD